MSISIAPRSEPAEGSIFNALRAPREERVPLLDWVPELADGLPARAAERLAHEAVAPLVRVEPGPWEPDVLPGSREPGLGFLVLDGILTRLVTIEERRACELVGPGDLIDPYAATELDSLEVSTAWRALSSVRLAALDGQFLTRGAGRSPHLLRALVARSLERTRNVTVQLTITRARHADARLRQLFWHVADRWGRATPAGVVVPLSLTHQTLGELVGLRRPTVTSSLAGLAATGEIVRRHDGTWLLAWPS